MLAQLTSKDFQPYLNQTFVVNPPSADPISLQLTSVTDLPAEANAERHPFSLIFHTPPKTHLAQQIYLLEHENFSELALFLVPVGPDSRGMQYEALFT